MPWPNERHRWVRRLSRVRCERGVVGADDREENEMIPHYNYYPPAGQVVDATDGRVQWNGRAWMLKGRVYGVPASHRLMGKPGTAHSGWYYDWGKRAWMEPSSAPAVQSQPQPQPRPQPRPQQTHLPVHRAPE